ncbi:phosphatidate cytidylyltransferase [Mangrovicoccus algicola]|uniref:Phosphatidate cytidylyltransferase n=1 Tax=Mangrovicoccus algicola TaxID=2771008 RepID=A0A8J7CGF9_9RHOB|nr:phosphatidate cytidylyltransferase [Mangrovicoccus algicola]MBE3637080.1 phosphatidate cytidylyltransferase [Mangrovicoccus algicola]
MSPAAGPGGSAQMADLGPRLLSGLVMAGLGLGMVAIGGLPLAVFVAAAVGLMVWELARMCGSGEAGLLAGVAGVSSLLAMLLPEGWGVPFLILPAFIGISRLDHRKMSFAIFAVLILLAGFGLVHVRGDFGPAWMAWLILVVVVTDVFGYFAGRLIGGPKFWPKISPKKTWSGTVAGWIGAALTGWAAIAILGGGSEVIGLSIGLSMASQLGDIAESALKRRAGVKDSSNLIPGHGGLFDRFDGMLGATVLFLMVEQVVGFPPAPWG